MLSRRAKNLFSHPPHTLTNLETLPFSSFLTLLPSHFHRSLSKAGSDS